MAEKTSEGGVGWFSVANFALTLIGTVVAVIGDQVWQNSIAVRGIEQRVVDLENRLDRAMIQIRTEQDLRVDPIDKRLDGITNRITAENLALRAAVETRNGEQDAAATRAAAGYMHQFDALAARVDRVEEHIDVLHPPNGKK